MPRLVFDVRANHDTGVSRYGLSVLPAAAGGLVERGWHVDVVVNSVQLSRAQHAVGGLGHRVKVHVATADEGFVRRSRGVRALACAADLYYTSHYLLDRSCPVPFVVTIHDLTRLRWPQFSYTDTTFAARFGPSELGMVQHELAALAAWQDPRFAGYDNFTRYFAALNRFLASHAERVVTVSQSSAVELQQWLDLPTGRIDVVPGGVDTTVFYPRPAAEADAIRMRLGVPGPYLVFVGLAHPNKRLDWLVEQLVVVRRRMPARVRLVAVGGHAEKIDAVHRRLLDAGASDFVVFAGRVTDAELAALYSGAAALVSASFSEGYGLPVQEALSCRCEVIVADIPVTRETAGEAAHRFPPASGHALADLACAALVGRLERRSPGHRPPSWRTAGNELAHVLARTWRYSPRQEERIRA
ncbi:MAG: glycosyltransferase family 4 protein [Pseudonocardiaceae bacterium]